MTEYQENLSALSASLIVRHSDDLDIALSDIFNPIDWAHDAANDVYFARLIKAKIISAKEVAKRRNAERAKAIVAEKLSTYPSTPTEFVAALTANMGVKVNWKGMMTVGDRHQTVLDLKRAARIEAVELGLREFDRGAIDDAAEAFFAEAVAARVPAMASALATRQDFDWDKLASFFVADRGMTRPLIIAVLKKWVHSARRKLVGQKVTYHLMPVIHGRQGCGKTYLIEQMVAPIAEAVAWSDFDQITDARNVSLWNSLVIVLDEMAKAARADIETVKHVITSEMLDRRPLYTNMTIPVLNRATMIGASNHRLDELVRDETGNRRFVELIYNTAVDRALIAQLDFAAMWASVQPEDADPLTAYRDDLARVQADLAVAGPVEDWLQSARPEAGEYTTAQLYTEFRQYRLSVTPAVDYQARTQNVFASELRRIVEQHAEYGIAKLHTRAGSRWQVEAQDVLRMVA